MMTHSRVPDESEYKNDRKESMPSGVLSFVYII